MVLNRDYVLRTTLGHIVGFRKNEKVFVHRTVVPLALAIGAEFSTEEEKAANVEEEAAKPKEMLPEEREKAVFAAFQVMKTRNNREDFNGAGYPNLKPLRVLSEVHDLDAAERTALWERFLNGIQE
jgi:hypothetical protein